MIVSAALFFAAPAFAQDETVGGMFYPACAPTDGAAVTIALDNHIQIMVYRAALVADEAYRTKDQVMSEHELATMAVSECDAKSGDCKNREGVLTVHRSDSETIEATLESFDGTEVQGDSESIEGKITSFTVQRDKKRIVARCL